MENKEKRERERVIGAWRKERGKEEERKGEDMERMGKKREEGRVRK